MDGIRSQFYTIEAGCVRASVAVLTNIQKSHKQ